MKLVALFAVAAFASADNADACSGLPEEPTAEVLAGAGVRPWIQMFLVKDSDVVAMSVVDKTRCIQERAKVCPGTPVEIERKGVYVRPKTALTPGTLVQLTSGTHTLTSFTVDASPARTELPAWSGVKVLSSGVKPAAGCASKGPVVTLQVQKTTANLDETVLLIYTKKPDAADPMKDLGFIRVMNNADAAGDTIMPLRNAKMDPTFMPAAVPKTIWVALADTDGHVGAPVEIKVKK